MRKKKIFAFVKRDYTTPREAIRAAVRDNYFKEKVKSVSVE